MAVEDESDTHQGRSWWILFPFRGITVDDPAFTLENPLWGDATVVSPAHVRQVAERAGGAGGDVWLKWGCPSAEGEAVGPGRAEIEATDCFLAVRRWVADHADEPSIPACAIERAVTVEAALALALVGPTVPSFCSCGFAHHLERRFSTVSAVDIASGGFHVHMRASSPLLTAAPTPVAYTRGQLEAAISVSGRAELIATLLMSPSAGDKGLHQVVRAAGARLVAAGFSVDTNDQVLGLVAALEILLSSGNHKQLGKRTSIILQGVLGADDGVEALLKARHAYVHEGTSAGGFPVPQAFHWVLVAAERVCRSGAIFTSKEELLKFLDIKGSISDLIKTVALPHGWLLTNQIFLGNQDP